MPSIDPEVMVHWLNIDPNFHTVRQKRKTFNPERYRAIKIEVKKLMKAGLIREVFYPSWLKNVVFYSSSNRPAGRLNIK